MPVVFGASNATSQATLHVHGDARDREHLQFGVQDNAVNAPIAWGNIGPDGTIVEGTPGRSVQ